MKAIHSEHEHDDVALLQDAVRRVIGWLLNGMLAAAIAGAGAFIYVAISERAQAQPELPRQDRRFEVLGGDCQYSKVGNYVWYNEHYQHELDMASGCALVAISSVDRNEGNLHLGWRLAYADLGLARSNAVFPMRDEDQISVLPDGTACDHATGFGCIGRGYGAQSARGISVGYVAEHDVWSTVVGAELGLFGYYGRWRVHIPPEPPSPQGPVDFDWGGWQITPYVGITLRHGYLVAMLRAYGRVRAAEHGCGGCSGIANGTALQAVVGMSVPF